MTLFSLILMRMTGFVLLNPVLGRKNIPALAKSGMVMALTVFLYTYAPQEVAETYSAIEFAILLLKEFFIGYILGFTMTLFEFVLSFAGSILDFQMGLSMATIYDPQSNAQMPLSGSIWNAYYFLLFFATDAHLALMKILLTSSQVVAYGRILILPRAFSAMTDIFIDCAVMGIKFTFPILAIEFLTEIAVGILMKAIPQINIFVVNIQAKVLIGLLMMLFLFSPMSDYLETIISQMMDAVQYVLRLM